ncbi:mandelate racemase/muconate lactonizing enzyme family protein [Marinobacterium rhizophilum]|uniref:Mandelate racemase/muconate lactonizing enzyme family protein n=1 Tax=Marinobacterium rhizophilum TaxID=420402 RepID=A0ABY5HGC9_9GAMM|nr:mandelate racemase/muconate lactonizing enzyme family protein [Marinobacterium rhizophilum]UTW11415.1 mandelate racemase/muconate lactonizing enzyme family protein [Marinobacterium rhizophilum]
MRITSFDIFLLTVPLGGHTYNPRLLWHRKQSVLLRLTDADGRKGWGECWCFDTSADPLIRFLQTEVRPLLLNREIESPTALWSELWERTSLTGRHGMMASALSGIDIALHDLIAQAAALPLGAIAATDPLQTTVPVYASAGLYRVNDTVERLSGEMSGLIAQGHDRVKIKFGALPFEQDVERMRAVRAAIGLRAGLIVDAVYSLDRAKTLAWLPIWQELGVEAVQAPFPVQDWASMRWLNRDCGMPVMVFESESRYEIFQALLQQGAIGVLQFSPVAVGGITAARRLMQLGRDYDVPVSLQCSSTWLAEAAALELARGHASVAHVELHTLHQGLFDCVPETERQPVDGKLQLHQRAGLGFAPPTSALSPADHDLPDLKTGASVQNQSAPTFGTA